MRAPPLEPSVELPMGTRNVSGMCRNKPGDACGPFHWRLRWSSLWGHVTCEGCAESGLGTHARPAACDFGGAPYGARKRVCGLPKWVWGRTRGLPLGRSVELPMRPRNVCAVCRLPGDAWVPCHQNLRWSSGWDRETCEGCATWAWHAGLAVGAFGGTPYGATKRVMGLPTWAWGRILALPPEPSVELPQEPRNV